MGCDICWGDVAKNALGANRPQDAVYGYGLYAAAQAANSRTIFVRTNKYVLHFKAPTAQKSAEEIPPVDGNGFWSITMYNIDGTLVVNKVASFHALSTNGTHARQVEATPPAQRRRFAGRLRPIDATLRCEATMQLAGIASGHLSQ